jgi:hypothetical protein
MATPSDKPQAKMNSRVVYLSGTIYFLMSAAYHWFAQHDGVKALGDLFAVLVGLFLIWYGRYIWGSLKRAFFKPSSDKTLRR